MGTESTTPMPTASEPKEPRTRTAFNILAAVAGVFGLGLELEGSHPYFGLALITVALVYGAWELFTSPVATQKLPLKFRIATLVILAGGLLWASWPHLRKIFKNDASQEGKNAKPDLSSALTTNKPGPNISKESAPPRSEPKLHVKNPAHPDVGLRFVYPQMPALVVVNKSDFVARNIKWMVI